eukprot:12918349-Prorocentrum_lima.AAC.1
MRGASWSDGDEGSAHIVPVPFSVIDSATLSSSWPTPRFSSTTAAVTVAVAVNSTIARGLSATNQH